MGTSIERVPGVARRCWLSGKCVFKDTYSQGICDVAMGMASCIHACAGAPEATLCSANTTTKSKSKGAIVCEQKKQGSSIEREQQAQTAAVAATISPNNGHPEGACVSRSKLPAGLE